MTECTKAQFDHNERLLEEIKTKSRIHRVSNSPFSDKLFDIENELRNRRKHFLGSYVSLTDLVCGSSGDLNEESFHLLVRYLTERTVFLWNKPSDTARKFCRHFYELSIIGIADIYMEDQCVDDIIRLATLLTHDSADIFEIVMEELLEQEYHPLLHSFLEDYEEEFYTASFEDAVLGAVCILLGVLSDPIVDEEVHHG